MKEAMAKKGKSRYGHEVLAKPNGLSIQLAGIVLNKIA